MKKRYLLAIIMMALLIAAVSGSTLLYAADENYYTLEQVNNFKSSGTYPAQDGKVFAGWYQDADYAKTYTGSESVDGVYAKFVNDDVLSVKFQISEGTVLTSDKTDLRLITSVDSLKFQSVGFDVTIGTKTTPLTSNTVYKTLNGYMDGNATAYQPTVFSEESQYFMSYRINEISKANFSTNITVTPKWTTPDGTVVTGIERTLTIERIIGNDVVVNEDGSVMLYNSAGKNRVEYTFEQNVMAGQQFSIDIDVEEDQNMAAWIMSEGGKEFKALLREPWSGNYTYTADITEELSKVKVLIEFRDSTKDWSNNIVTLSNLKVAWPEGTIAINGSGTGSDVYYTIPNSAVVSGSTITYKITTNWGNFAAWSLGDGSKEFTAGTATKTMTVNKTVTDAADYIKIKVQYRDSGWNIDSTTDKSPYYITISDIKITHPEGTTIIYGSGTGSDVYYTIPNSAVVSGSTITYKITTNWGNFAAWSLGDGSKEFTAGTATKTMTVNKTVTDAADYIRIKVQYRDSGWKIDSTTDKSPYYIAISDIEITPPAAETE